MNDERSHEPWKHIITLIEHEEAVGLEAFLQTLSATEVARAISRLDHDDQIRLLTLLTPEQAADIIEEVEDVQAADLIEKLDPEKAAAIIDELQSDAQADLLGDLDEKDAEAIPDAMTPEEAVDARYLLKYPSDTAGGVVITEYLAYNHTLHVSDVLEDLQVHRDQYYDYDIQYVYVVEDDNKLMGVLKMSDLLLAYGKKELTEVMIPQPACVRADASIEDLDNFFEKHAFIGVPVVIESGGLVGVGSREDVQEAITEQSNKVYLETSGIVGGEEFRSMPFLRRASRRLSWLSVNVVLNIMAAGVIVIYQDTLEKAITLAIFLPIIPDMSGCSGNQAVAVSIRELSLGLVRPREIMRVFYKESIVGLINGVILGALVGGAAFLWQGNPYLGLVVGSDRVPGGGGGLFRYV